MFVGYRSDAKAAQNIWITGDSDPTVFQPNSLVQVKLPTTMEYMCHVMVDGKRVDSPTLKYDSIVIYDGNTGTWVAATPN